MFVNLDEFIIADQAWRKWTNLGWKQMEQGYKEYYIFIEHMPPTEAIGLLFVSYYQFML